MAKREDDLISLAFGDVSGERAEQLRRACAGDSNAMRALRDYETMREGLRGLKDIPEMQMSSERLRDAILKDGLKPHPKPWFNWNLLAWPAAACLLVVVGTKLLPQQSPVAAIIESTPESVALRNEPKGPTFDTEMAKPSAGDPSAFVKAITDSQPAPIRFEGNSSRKASRSAPAVAARPRAAARKGAVVSPSRALASIRGAADSVLASAAPPDAVASKPADETSIVIIDSTPNPDTGAERAREVTSDNVVVGG